MSNKGGRAKHKEWINFSEIRDDKNKMIAAKCKLCDEKVTNFGEARMAKHV